MIHPSCSDSIPARLLLNEQEERFQMRCQEFGLQIVYMKGAKESRELQYLVKVTLHSSSPVPLWNQQPRVAPHAAKLQLRRVLASASGSFPRHLIGLGRT